MTTETLSIDDRLAEARLNGDSEAVGKLLDERDAGRSVAFQRAVNKLNPNLDEFERMVAFSESETVVDYLDMIGADESVKVRMLEEYATDLLSQPLKLKVISAYWLELWLHDPALPDGILGQAVDKAITLLRNYDRASTPARALKAL